MATLTVDEILRRLEALRHEPTRARHRRLGAGENQFGDRVGDIRKPASAT